MKTISQEEFNKKYGDVPDKALNLIRAFAKFHCEKPEGIGDVYMYISNALILDIFYNIKKEHREDLCLGIFETLKRNLLTMDFGSEEEQKSA